MFRPELSTTSQPAPGYQDLQLGIDSLSLDWPMEIVWPVVPWVQGNTFFSDPHQKLGLSRNTSPIGRSML